MGAGVGGVALAVCGVFRRGVRTRGGEWVGRSPIRPVVRGWEQASTPIGMGCGGVGGSAPRPVGPGGGWARGACRSVLWCLGGRGGGGRGVY